jgi:hypothetical protein
MMRSMVCIAVGTVIGTVAFAAHDPLSAQSTGIPLCPSLTIVTAINQTEGD